MADTENNNENPQENKTLDYDNSNKVISPNVVLQQADNTTVSFNSKKYENPDETESKVSYFASADVNIPTSEKNPQPEPTKERANEEFRNIFNINSARGEKPTDIIKNVNKFPNADNIQESADIDKKDRSKLDDADKLGMKQVDQGIYHEAEIVKINNHLKEYDLKLRQGRELEEEEVKLLRVKFLETLPRYKNFQSNYESIGLTEKDKEILLNTHFSKEIKDFDDSLKDSNGKYSSSKCNIEQLASIYQNYKKELISQHNQDMTAREQNKDEERKQQEIENYKKEFKEKYGIDWSIEAEKMMQQNEILRTERDLYKENNDNNTVVNPGLTTENPQGGKSEIKDPNIEKRERNWKRAALIAGVVAGGTTGIVGGVPAGVVGVLSCIGAGVINSGVDYIVGSKIINKITEQLKTVTDLETKDKLEKRLKKWEKVREGTKYVKSFLTGAKLGLLGSTIFSGIFMGGHGLIWNQAEIAASMSAGNTDISSSSSSFENNPAVETTSPINQSIPETSTTQLPNSLSLNQYPNMRTGLETRGMAKGMNELVINPGESIWSNAQRQAVDALVNQGVNLNTREAGYAIGDLASNLINNGQAITPDAVTQALAEAATKFSQ